MTCFPPCLLSFLSHHNHHHNVLKDTKNSAIFQKNIKLERKKPKNKKTKKNAKSQFWLRRTRKVDATGPDFGCKFRLRRSPGASESVFGPEAVQFLVFFLFFFFFCVAYFWRSFNTARFSDDSRFLRLAYFWVSFIKAFFSVF